MEEFSTEALITARLEELVDHRTPWHRSLWQVGSLLALREVVEYAEGTRAGTMKAEGLAHVTTSAAKLVRRDLGLGGEDVRDAIVEILDKGSAKSGVHDLSVADSLEQFVRRAERDYLRRWSEALHDGEVTSANLELFARLIVAHLLDAGFSGDHLHGWLRASADQGTPLSALLEKADEMFSRAPVHYRVVVPFKTLPQEVIAAAGTRFVEWDEMVALVGSEGVEPPPGRKGAGGIVFTVTAREPKAAQAEVEIEVRRLSARVVVGLSSKSVEPTGDAVALGGNRPRWRPLRSRQKEILVSSIVRHRLLLPAARSQHTRALDDAFELLAAVETATSWASVAAIWAAVEGLLARAGDSGASAADRMANVVAGGFVRAEMTQLAEVLGRNDDELGQAMRSSSVTQAVKLDRLFSEICADTPLLIDEPSDMAAVGRIKALVADPVVVMERVRDYYRDAFRRLFTQRNLLLHGGRFDSVTLPATMRTVPPLVAAGVDRLVHAAMQEGSVTPFGVAARAENEIRLLGGPGARRLHRLLD